MLFRSEDRVGHGMGDRVGVGMSREAQRMRNVLAGEDQGPAGFEPVGVVPDPDPDHAATDSATGSGRSE